MILVIIIVGAVSGTFVGLIAGGVMESGGVIAVISAVLSIVVAKYARSVIGGYLARSAPASEMEAAIPTVVLTNALMASLVGGLAGYAISIIIGVHSGALIGFFSGVLATVQMALLMVTYYSQRAHV